MQTIKENDSTYICRYYNKYGPMVKQESFKDEQCTIPNGLFCWYNSEGYLDSAGWINKGFKDRYWDYLRKEKRYLILKYKDRKVVEKQDFDAGIYVDSTGIVSSLKEKKIRDSLRADSLKPVQVVAKFNGDWSAYLNRHLNIPQRLENVMGKGSYVVKTSFLVDKEGQVTEVYLMKSCE